MSKGRQLAEPFISAIEVNYFNSLEAKHKTFFYITAIIYLLIATIAIQLDGVMLLIVPSFH